MGIYNLSGISITYYINASARSVVDPARSMFIWVFSILFGWEHWITMQFVGFVVAS